MSRDAMFVGLGLLATTILSGLQALVLVVVADVGEETDGFLAAYAVYSSVAIMGISARRSLVPLLLDRTTSLRERTNEIVSRVALLGIAAGALIAVLAVPLAALLTNGLSATARHAALVTLLVLAPASALQIIAGACSAALSAARRLPLSMGLYAGSSLIAVVTSAALLSAVGIVGAAVGVAVGALCTAASHTVCLRSSGVRPTLEPAWARDREQRLLAVSLVAAGALAASQQLTLAVALSAVGKNPGDITTYSYGYLAVMVLLNVTVGAVSLVAVPSMVEAVAAQGRSALERQLLLIAPYVFVVLLPLLATLGLFGGPVLEFVFGAVMSDADATQLSHVAAILTLAGIPTSVFVLCVSLLLAVRENAKALAVAVGSVLVHLAILSVAARGGPTAVAYGHVGAASVTALLIVVAVFGRSTRRVLVRLGRGIAPAFGLATVFPVVYAAMGGTHSSLPLAAVAIIVTLLAYATLTALAWPPVAQPFLRPLQGLLARARRNPIP